VVFRHTSNMENDFTLTGHGSVYLLTPNTEAATEWLNDNLAGDLLRLGNSVAVEHRFVDHVMDGIESDGLTVARG